MKSIGIIGYGIVGKATEVTLRRFYDPRFNMVLYDKKILGSSIEEVAGCSIAFICLPTPSRDDGKCDTSLVEGAIQAVIETCKKTSKSLPMFVIRSTVVPGTTDFLSQKLHVPISFMPEFLTENRFWEDAEKPPFIVIGGGVETAEIAALFANSGVPTHVTAATTAELLKYAMNTLFATKVIFANQIYNISHQLKDCDYSQIREIMYSHPWVGSNHLDVWHGGFRGYSGKCLPKDTKAIAFGFNNEFFKLVDQLNEELLRIKP